MSLPWQIHYAGLLTGHDGLVHMLYPHTELFSCLNRFHGIPKSQFFYSMDLFLDIAVYFKIYSKEFV